MRFVSAFFCSVLISTALFGGEPAPAVGLVPVEGLGIRIQPGFNVSLFSDHTLANDIYCMTLDSKGRVVVSSAGWIKTLIDDNNDGKADRAELFGKINTGAMGLCFDGNDLLAVGDGALLRYVDADGDGKADSDKPERLLTLGGGEHGAHGIRKGPDGCWYLIGGNDTNFTADKHANAPLSPIKAPETGCILRISPDFKQTEVIAHGFRNPYDFDFNAAGDIFCYDSDCERDYFLPWYTPTRIYHAAYGMHHGWRLKGYLRSYCRLDYYPDSVDILAPLGRGSPTGVTVYRHNQFPGHYQGAVFALDWTFGKVWFMPLKAKGAGYETAAQVFMEPTGTDGFAPTDVCVGTEGEMYVSIGGRRTKGSVFKITVPGYTPPKGDTEDILYAPQPLDAWSRRRNEALVKKTSVDSLEASAFNAIYTMPVRVRAIEVLAEFHGGLRETFLNKVEASGANLPEQVRARIAWALRTAPKSAQVDRMLVQFASSDSPILQRAAIETMLSREVPENRPGPFGLDSPDKRVAQVAAALFARQYEGSGNPAPAIMQSTPADPDGSRQSLLSCIHGLILSGRLKQLAIPAAPRLFAVAKTPKERFDALRLTIRALGDMNLNKPSKEVFSNYELPEPLVLDPVVAKEFTTALQKNFDNRDEGLDIEIARAFAILQDDKPETFAAIIKKITPKSHPTNDIHYLICIARLGGILPADHAEKLAGALLGLSRKLDGLETREKQVWSLRVMDLVEIFSKRVNGFNAALVAHPDFVRPAHVGLADKLNGEERLAAAKRFADAAANDPKFPWSESIINMLALLPADTVHPLLRKQWSNFGLRDSIVLNLATKPDAGDRAKFLFGLEAPNYQIVEAAMKAIEALPKDDSGGDALALVKLLRRLASDPGAKTLRAHTLKLLARDAGQPFDIAEAGTTPQELKKSYEPVGAWFLKAFPKRAEDLNDGDENPEALRAQLKDVPWDKADATRGEAVFRERGCQTCHAVQGALGPSLNGAASRFAKEDLFEAIAFPSKDVAPPYKTTTFKMKDGQIVTGLVAFESADGYIIQTGATTTVRIDTANIVFKRPSTQSLMPQGLLAGLTPEQMADLYAYLRGVK